ncbi:DUF4367 domain-containing protein [Miniphocaeibacter massiliensis]|uniref:DUF4367 domain-containing protein n=1 Tax=Miniphocaeibacter massiliensis TaxID=2041841 RepID=UPI000C1BB769|nr:DUF4367 domain-containing protein [Miniphocaeibacter massiliensis]
MQEKYSIDELLNNYAEKILESKYDREAENITSNIKKENIQMDISFQQFWENKDKLKNKTTIKKKRKRKTLVILVATLILAIIIGPKNIATYATEVYNKLVTVLEDRTIITYDVEVANIEIKKPTYIPKGYKITDEFNESNKFVLTYSNGLEEEVIIFDISPLGSLTNPTDTEDSKTYTKKILNREVSCIENDKGNMVYCEVENQLYSVWGNNIDIDELFKMLESVLKQY